MTEALRPEEARALNAAEALAALAEAADAYEAEARRSHVWDEGGATETIIGGIQQFRDAARSASELDALPEPDERLGSPETRETGE